MRASERERESSKKPTPETNARAEPYQPKRRLCRGRQNGSHDIAKRARRPLGLQVVPEPAERQKRTLIPVPESEAKQGKKPRQRDEKPTVGTITWANELAGLGLGLNWLLPPVWLFGGCRKASEIARAGKTRVKNTHTHSRRVASCARASSRTHLPVQCCCTTFKIWGSFVAPNQPTLCRCVFGCTCSEMRVLRVYTCVSESACVCFSSSQSNQFHICVLIALLY